MVFIHICHLCGKETVFHDDERVASLLLCMDCTGEWAKHKLIAEIMSGDFVPPEKEKEEPDEDSTDEATEK